MFLRTANFRILLPLLVSIIPSLNCALQQDVEEDNILGDGFRNLDFKNL